MDSRDIVRRLKQEGWKLARSRGSHQQYTHDDRPGRVTVPHPKRDIPLGTLKSIFKQAGWKWSEP